MKKMKKEELELLSYQDIAKLVLSEKKKGETTINLFTEICKMLDLSNDELQDKIGDFYTGLTIDQRFIILKDGKWDLKANHTVQVVVEDEEENDDEIEEIEEKYVAEEDEESVVEDNGTDDLDTQPDDDFEEDELEDLVIVTEEDLNEN